MKQSEMVAQISQLLVLCKNKELGYGETAREIISLIEDRGMLPPPNYNETYYSSDEPGGYSPNNWEEE